ncbi:MAG TPA: tetratricopeptide repeat protein [Vicinamibacterales bacterium]|jgi:tetratricopeptide (TPR) repeat protein
MALCAGWLACVLATASVGGAAAQPASAETLRARGTELVYEHEHDEAIKLLRQAVALAPEDPATHRSLAGALWLKMLFLRGAVTVDHYLGSFTRPRVDLKKPAPELVAEFTAEIARAVDLAEKRVATRPKDPQARYDLGAAVGLQASYVASIEGKLLAGFRSARRAYAEHEKVMELDPARKDAWVTVGTYRYIISTLSAPMRVMAYVAGFGSGKERGIKMLEETAAAGGEAATDAHFALVLLYNREKRYDEALRSLQELRKLHPRNRLVVLEAGSTSLRAGRAAQADALLTEGLGLLAKSTGPRIPGEETLWRYKRGAARAALGRLDEAAADLKVAIGGDAQSWVQGRAHVELARIALRRGDRATAASEVRQAETLCEHGSDQPCVDDARRLLRNADGR